MKIVLGILVMFIGLGVIYCNAESNNPKEWLNVGGCVVFALGLGHILLLAI